MARILVVDDDPMMIELYREILTLAGHNGYEFVKRLRLVAGHARTPVIAASGLCSGEWALRLGADRFLVKPFHNRELLALVNELLSDGAVSP